MFNNFQETVANAFAHFDPKVHNNLIDHDIFDIINLLVASATGSSTIHGSRTLGNRVHESR